MKPSLLLCLSFLAAIPLFAENTVSDNVPKALAATSSPSKEGGTLGAHSVYLYGMLEKCDFEDGGTGDYWGYGIATSRNLFENDSGLGLDASIRFETWKNKGGGPESRYHCDTYMISVTSYLRKGSLTPFATLSAYRDDTTSATVKGKNSTYGGLKVGIEWLPANRWHITPAITYWHAVEADDNSDYYVNYRLEAGYRIHESATLIGGLNHGDCEGLDQYWCDLGILWRY